MIENLFTSKTRIKLLKIFLSNPDKRYYLRGLEKELQESLTPLRRELLRLTNMGILSVQNEANIKYYSLNKDFERLEELQKLVLGRVTTERALSGATPARNGVAERAQASSVPKREADRVTNQATTFVMAVLLVVLIGFLVWTNSRNIQNLAKAISSKSSTSLFEAKPRASDERGLASDSGGMRSGRWKIMPGNWPVLGEAGEGKNGKSKEL